MNKNFYLKSLIANFSDERNVGLDIIYDILEQAVFSVFKQKFKPLNLSIFFDVETCAYDVYSRYVGKNCDKYEISLKNSFDFFYEKNGINIISDNSLKKKIIASFFKRKELSEAKNIISTKLMMLEKQSIVVDYAFFLDKTTTVIVKKKIGLYFFVYVEKGIYGILSKNEMIPNESIELDSQLKIYIQKIVYYNNEPFLYVTRICNEILFDLLKLEIPEINDNLIVVKRIVRNPGIRSKIVISTDLPIDPIRVCIGFNRLRIKNISNFLNGEKIDLILWHQDIKKFCVNMFPGIVINNIELDYKNKIVYLSVNESFVSIMLGERGINVALLNKLTTWHLNILNVV